MPVITHALGIFKLWHVYKNDFPKGLQRTLGERIDLIFISILEDLFVASYQNKTEKLPTLLRALKRTDLLKFFLQISWEFHALSNDRYATISEQVYELGRMIGGWKNGLESKLLQHDTGGELL